MRIISRKNLTYVFVLLCVAGVIALGINRFFLLEGMKELKTDITELERKAGLLQRKYGEQKRQSEELLRLKASLEGRQREGQTEIGKKEKDLKSLTDENISLKKDKAGLTKNIEALALRNKQVGMELKDIQSTYRQVVDDFHDDLVRVVNTNKELEAKLSRKTIEMERCVSHNADLCEISRELIKMYKNKGVISALVEKEPLTQIKKVTLEEYIQEYEDKVDDLKIEKQNK